MAEFESGYCTGCGFPAGKSGVLQGVHRPYCWRKTTMMLGIEPTHEVQAKLLIESAKHWRFLAWLVRRRMKMYYLETDTWVLDETEPAQP